MLRKKIVLTAAFALLFAGISSGVYAQITVSGGLALSSVTETEVSGSGGSYNTELDAKIGLGGQVYVDYLLPISIPLSLGLEIGVDNAKAEADGYEDSITAIPILIRAAYHFDLLPKLDLYVVGKIGYAIGIWTGDTRDYLENYNVDIGAMGGVAFGFDVGAAYYFTPLVGIFGEAGFDDYALEAKIKDPGSTVTLKVPFYRFVTIGVSVKF